MSWHNIGESNVLEILTMAKQHNCEFLAQTALNKMQGLELGRQSWKAQAADRF